MANKTADGQKGSDQSRREGTGTKHGYKRGLGKFMDVRLTGTKTGVGVGQGLEKFMGVKLEFHRGNRTHRAASGRNTSLL